MDTRRLIDAIDPRNPDLAPITSRLLDMQTDAIIADSIDEALFLLSEKLKGRGPEVERSSWVPPDSFHRSTSKYWVKSSDSIKVKCMILPHLPILAPESPLPSATSPSSSLITSVYLDNSDLSLFHSRLFREDESSLVRIRWYGDIPRLNTWPASPLDSDPTAENSTIFVERKKHREAWTGELSSKERSPISISCLGAYLSGHGPELNPCTSSASRGSLLDCPYPEGAPMSPMCLAPPPSPMVLSPRATPGGGQGKDAEKRRKAAFLREVQHFIASQEASPILKTSYTRTAFQRSDTNAVRLSFDENVVMTAHPSQSKVFFDYCILEIKLQDGDQHPPDWLQRIKESGMLVEVPKFSKYGHGISLLFPAKIKRSPSYFVPTACTNGSHISLNLAVLSSLLPPGANSQGIVYESTAGRKQKWRPATFEELQSADLADDESERGLMERSLLPPDIRVQKGEKVPQKDGSSTHNGSSSSREDEGVMENKGVKPAAVCSGGEEGEVTFRTIEISPSDEAPTSDQVRGCLSLLDQKWTRKPLTYHPVHDIEQPSAPALVRSRVEPKTYFANERTFLSWMQMGVLLMFAALSLMSSTSSVTGGTPPSSGTGSRASRVAGLTLAPIAILLFLYALVIYRTRTSAIMRREAARFDDQRGPVLLALLLIIVTSFIYALHIIEA